MTMRSPIVLFSVVLLCSVAAAFSQVPENDKEQAATVSLAVSAGVPLRLYLTKRLSKRDGEPVHAKLLEPVFAFDREVIPAGAEVVGKVARLDPVSKMMRFSAIIGGDFSPLHRAQVAFTTVVLPDGRQIALHSDLTTGLNSIYSPQPPKKSKQKKTAKAQSNGGALGTGKQQIQTQIQNQINSRSRGVADLVRGPDKLERLEEFLVAKLPYHPQWVRKGTRFDAELLDPLPFGTAQFKLEQVRLVGSAPPPDAVVHARLITPLNSAIAQKGQKVEAIVSQPLFSNGNLIVPEGSHVSGSVILAHKARWFHRGGQLRFNFQNVALPAGFIMPANADRSRLAVNTRATLDAAESGGKTAIKVDDEGGVKAVEPKTRFIAPAIAVLIAMRSMDNDRERVGNAEGANTGGRTLGGFSGLGLLGAISAQASKTVGSVLGVYGMCFSIYTNVIARGGEVEFGNNSAVDIRFGGRQQAPGLKIVRAADGGE